MGVRFKELIPAKVAENTNTTQYTADGCTAIIGKFTAINTSASNANFSVYITAEGDGLTEATRIIKERQLAPSETYTCPELSGHVLDEGAFISTVASAASAITIRCSGREITT
jgi:hypothetical protein